MGSEGQRGAARGSVGLTIPLPCALQGSRRRAAPEPVPVEEQPPPKLLRASEALANLSTLLPVLTQEIAAKEKAEQELAQVKQELQALEQRRVQAEQERDEEARQRVVADLQRAKAEAQRRKAEKRQAKAEKRQAKAERGREVAERARAEAEKQRAGTALALH